MKKVYLLFVGVSLVSMLMACSGGNKATSTDTIAAQTTEQTEIVEETTLSETKLEKHIDNVESIKAAVSNDANSVAVLEHYNNILNSTENPTNWVLPLRSTTK